MRIPVIPITRTGFNRSPVNGTHSAMGAIQSNMTGEDGTLCGSADPRRRTFSAMSY